MLTGTGGCGKTRLAVEVASDVASRFSDGARWVELQGVSDVGSVAARKRTGWAPVETLVGQLHGRQLLLVLLDNCEHVVAACAELVGGLSSACPQLHTLATSRVPLAVEGEATFDVGPCRRPKPMPGPPAMSWPRTRRGWSRYEPGRWPRTFGSMTTTLRPWPISYGVWTESP